VERYPRSAQLFQCIGKVEFERGHVDPSFRFAAGAAAEVALRRSLELAPDDPWTHLYLASLHYGRGQYDEAIERCRRAHDLAPRLELPLTHMADAYACLRKYEQADACYRRAAEIDPNSEVARERLEKWLKFWLPEQKRRRNRAGRCRACGYDVRDAQFGEVAPVSAVCPNCGEVQPPTR
jgi:tetratricopeptide (TPR) repeat protein